MTPASLWNERPVTGEFVDLDDDLWYRIRNVDRLPPFLTSLASSSDHWLFASSRGPLTAGRRSARAALFPYTTDDRLHDAVDRSGRRTIVHVDSVAGPPWEPGSGRGPGHRDISRDLLKNSAGTALRFEEHAHDLQLTWRTEWTTAARFGVICRVQVHNTGAVARRLRIVDGLLNLLPADVEPALQQGFSCLVDAYKSAHLAGDARVGVFALSSIPVDRAEPSEALRGTVVRCVGAPTATRLLSEDQLDAALRGAPTAEESHRRGRRGAFLIDHIVELEPGATRDWLFTLEVEQDAAALSQRLAEAADDDALHDQVLADIAASARTLTDLVAAADGAQHSDSPARDARHFSNTLFNLMRGGTLPDGHHQDRDDFVAWLGEVAPQILTRHRDALADWPAQDHRDARTAAVAALGDIDLQRLHREYLPLAFSRRHGDPSRPWNTFSIDSRNTDGSLRRGYEGNWRDIFQNWEALALAFPAYVDAFVTRFVNASTADGYNPYRINRGGVDWEVQDDDDPWSYIGYWGDHQIVYLTRLLERSEALAPGRLGALLDRQEFVSVDVPYRIRGHAELVADPHDTVLFDHDRAAEIDTRVTTQGNEGKLTRTASGELLRMGLAEKLLVPVLVKLTNLVPGAGVWMNTQRPEWNDANNALVGFGASMVTTCALWLHCGVLRSLLNGTDTVHLHDSTTQLIEDLDRLAGAGAAAAGPVARRRCVDRFGSAGERHRNRVYAGDFGARHAVAVADLLAFLDDARDALAATIHANRRDDGLYHGYNLIAFRGDQTLEIRRLALMLEGQVAVLACGLLDARTSLAVLDALRDSPLYCPRRDSYILYPDRELPPFFARGALPDDLATTHPAAAQLLDELRSAGHADGIVSDDAGTLRFAAPLRNARVLATALDDLGEQVPPSARQQLLDVYEQVFDHAAFTGRSGTFFGYEGLGCIYWHMVSKLALAVQDTYWRLVDHGTQGAELDRLRDHYHAVRRGLGMEASPAEWGAFPTDAYSHTPRDGGARQPGMTGQVKEDLLCRLGEVGLRLAGGELRIAPALMPTAQAEFTLCGTPVQVAPGEHDAWTLRLRTGAAVTVTGSALGPEHSASILGRSGTVDRLDARYRAAP